VKFRRISEVLCLQVLQKKLWAHFHDLCVQTRSCLLWSSDAFWKFLLCQVYEQSFGRILMIDASNSEAVCCEIQTHFRSSPPLRLTEKVLDKFSRFIHLQTKLFVVKFRHILEVFSVQALEKSYGCICSIFVSKNEAVCCWVQTHFGSFTILKFMKNVLGAFSWFMCPKTKLFAVKFRRISEVLRLQDLQKKVLGAISRFVCHATNHSWLQHFGNILHAHKSLLCCTDTLWSSWLSHFVKTHCFESEHIWSMTAHTNCVVQV